MIRSQVLILLEVVLFATIVDAQLTPNDSSYQQQWALAKVQAAQAWSVTTGSSSIIIAIIDGGFDLSHQDLSGKFVTGHDFIGRDDVPELDGNQ